MSKAPGSSFMSSSSHQTNDYASPRPYKTRWARENQHAVKSEIIIFWVALINFSSGSEALIVSQLPWREVYHRGILFFFFPTLFWVSFTLYLNLWAVFWKHLSDPQIFRANLFLISWDVCTTIHRESRQLMDNILLRKTPQTMHLFNVLMWSKQWYFKKTITKKNNQK